MLLPLRWPRRRRVWRVKCFASLVMLSARDRGVAEAHNWTALAQPSLLVLEVQEIQLSHAAQ
jgi:hypothetical protein